MTSKKGKSNGKSFDAKAREEMREGRYGLLLILEGVEVGEEVVDLYGVKVGLRGHEVAAVEDRGGHAVVVGGGAAMQVGLLVDAEQRWAVQVAGGAVVVAERAVGLKGGVAEVLLGRELIERRGGWGGVAAEKQ